jgi:hypothetical protein
MKRSIMKCTQWHLQWQCRLILASAAMWFFVLSAQAQTDAILPPLGGPGGSQFVARCPQGQLLTGFELRTGDDVDAIRPLCVTAYGPRETSDASLTTGSGLITIYKDPWGTKFDLVKLESGWYGGTGGGIRNIICPQDAPIVTGMFVGWEGRKIYTVNNIHLFCGVAATTQTPSEFPSAVFDGPATPLGDSFLALGDDSVSADNSTQRCPAGLVAVGINGRSGKWLDAVGLICAPPKLRPELGPVKAVRRTQAPGATGVSSLSICEAARQARARNNAAAPGLEAQCRAAGAVGKLPPVEAVPRTKTGAPTGSPRAICDLARAARARNSPAAAGLEESCRTELAAKGAAIAQVDPVVAQARAAETDAQYQQGFDIATGIFGDPALGAQGNTATGPGSLGIRDSLSAAGQRGFNDAVKLHLSRNYKP